MRFFSEKMYSDWWIREITHLGWHFPPQPLCLVIKVNSIYEFDEGDLPYDKLPSHEKINNLIVEQYYFNMEIKRNPSININRIKKYLQIREGYE